MNTQFVLYAFRAFMVAAAVAFLACLALGGCAWTSASYTTWQEGKPTKRVTYWSSRDTVVEVNTNGTVKLEGKASVVIDAQAKAMGYVAGQAAEGAAKGAKPGP